jgi:hypothetical protein
MGLSMPSASCSVNGHKQQKQSDGLLYKCCTSAPRFYSHIISHPLSGCLCHLDLVIVISLFYIALFQSQPGSLSHLDSQP